MSVQISISKNLVILLRKLKKCYIAWKFQEKFVLWTHKINQETETFCFDDLDVTGVSDLQLIKVVGKSYLAIPIHASDL